MRPEDRRAAARLLGVDIDDLRTRMADDNMLRGLSIAYAALAAPELDPDALRRGIMLVTGYLRDRQRFGDRPSPPSSAS